MPLYRHLITCLVSGVALLAAAMLPRRAHHPFGSHRLHHDDHSATRRQSHVQGLPEVDRPPEGAPGSVDA